VPESSEFVGLADSQRKTAGPDELRSCLVVKEQAVRALRAKVAALEYLDKISVGRISLLSARADDMEALISAMQAHITGTEAQCNASNAQVTALQAQLAEMAGSAAWKLVQLMRRARQVMCPTGSGREKVYLLGRQTWRTYRREGSLRVLAKIRRKMLGIGSRATRKALRALRSGSEVIEGLGSWFRRARPAIGPVGTVTESGQQLLAIPEPTPDTSAPEPFPENPEAVSNPVPASTRAGIRWWEKPEAAIDLPILREILANPPRVPSGPVLVDVIVPVYGGLDFVLRCLRSILAASSATAYELIVINDGSPDPAVSNCLRLIAERGLLTLIDNPSNLGFVRSANLGLSRSPDRDVVLLNSDTEVYGNWLDRLRKAAYSGENVATATPLSNNATICSYPRFFDDNPIPSGIDPASLDAICARVNEGAAVDIPTGVGFCLYVRRDCVRQIGLFNAQLFGRGYGEENDFCMRAHDSGWRHVLVADTFVYHRGGVSFGTEKASAVERAGDILNQKHARYSALVGGHLANDPAHPLRRRIDLARVAGSKPAMLFVLHDLGGGAERHVLDMASRLEEEGTRALVLRPAGDGNVRLDCPAVADTPNLLFDAREEYWTLREALLDLGVQHVHFHHLINVPGQVMNIIADLNLPYDCTLHDYYAICPRINLINGTGAYCGEPNEQGCQLCIDKNLSYQGNRVDVGQWRRAHGDWLAGARRVFVPHAEVGKRLARHFSRIDFVERRHFERAMRPRNVCAPFSPDETLRVALLGTLAPHKGLEIVLACGRDALARNLPIRFHIIGHPTSPEILALPNVACTGAYKEDAVFDLLEKERCHCAFFPSLCPETYSYTLSIALMGQLTPIAFDFGVQAERIREIGFDYLLPPTTDPVLINDRLLQCSATFGDLPTDLNPSFGQYHNLLADYYGLCRDQLAEAA